MAICETAICQQERNMIEMKAIIMILMEEIINLCILCYIMVYNINMLIIFILRMGFKKQRITRQSIKAIKGTDPSD